MNILTFTLSAIAVAFLTIPLLFTNAWALSVLWGWFVVPLFNLPELGLSSAAGLRLVAGILKPGDMSKSKTKPPKEFFIWWANITFTAPGMALAVGWVLLVLRGE